MFDEANPWPWDQIIDDSATMETYESDAEYALAKKMIDQDFGKDKLVQSWIATCTELEKLTEEIKAKQEAIFPVLSMQDLKDNKITPEKISEIRRVGSFIVSGVIPSKETEEIFDGLKGFLARNEDQVSGYPSHEPAIYRLYSTPAQNRLRSHPELIKVMLWANDLWEYEKNDPETSPDPLVYADRLRIRRPGAKFLGLGPHVDSGGLCRWTEPYYRKVYSEVFEGDPVKLNCYDMSRRKDANQGYYSERTPTVLRCFQGWTALTDTAARQGTILLYPNVQLLMAYLLLRPFFKPPEDSTKTLDPREWTYDVSGCWFPGITKKGGVNLSPSSHPHLRLEQNLLHVPPLSAGDTIWWHSDVCHAVDPEHMGKRDASVAYIAATPTTRRNKSHMQGQYDKMVAGLPPPDYDDGIDESKLDGFEGFKGKEAVFKQLMGY